MIVFEKKWTQEDIDNGNDIPRYGVSWDHGMGRVGNSWASKAKATEVWTRKFNEGRNPTATERRVAGYI